MSEHRAEVHWRLGESRFDYDSYSRNHDWYFPAPAITIPASAAPKYRGDASRIDPEEAFVASVASCHMLTLLAIASRKRMTIESYDDNALGIMAKNEHGRLAIVEVILRPRVVFSGDKQPDSSQLAAMHESAHRECFIANSVNCRIRIED